MRKKTFRKSVANFFVSDHIIPWSLLHSIIFTGDYIISSGIYTISTGIYTIGTENYKKKTSARKFSYRGEGESDGAVKKIVLAIVEMFLLVGDRSLAQ